MTDYVDESDRLPSSDKVAEAVRPVQTKQETEQVRPTKRLKPIRSTRPISERKTKPPVQYIQPDPPRSHFPDLTLFPDLPPRSSPTPTPDRFFTPFDRLSGGENPQWLQSNLFGPPQGASIKKRVDRSEMIEGGQEGSRIQGDGGIVANWLRKEESNKRSHTSMNNSNDFDNALKTLTVKSEETKPKLNQSRKNRIAPVHTTRMTFEPEPFRSWQQVEVLKAARLKEIERAELGREMAEMRSKRIAEEFRKKLIGRV